ncbi:mynd finger family protein [Colletotrichum kahawae]|uniref:Mynd finger family protein n=1 Tax=Colletotrichum kahawae TaxID=34407 RepID=A0AAD9Y5H6_COLKA|nr:mynd finger family protein [Colletotrichum kahawae]
MCANRAPDNTKCNNTGRAGKYLWGNVPAFDVLRLGANEGVSYDEQLRLLFAASGDLRNVIKTIGQLPNSYTQPIEVTINDRDLNIVAWNVIMLLISLVVDDIDIAADYIIHVWYSALLCKSDLDIMQHRIRPVLEEDDLLSFTDTPKGLTANRAHEIYKAVTLAEGRKDYCDRHLLLQSLSYRIALTRFREDGLLLPFEAARDAFRHPNPFLENSTFSRIEVSNISDAGYLGIYHTLDLMIPLL